MVNTISMKVLELYFVVETGRKRWGRARNLRKDERKIETKEREKK